MKIYTLDDIYALPDGEHAELIDGQIYMMAPPNRKHQTIARDLFSSINSYIKSTSGSCESFFAPFAVFLNKDDTRDYTFSESVKASIYDDLYINFSDIAELLNI